MKQTIVVDFDGTITQQDVFCLLLDRHGGLEGEKINQGYYDGTILPYQSLIDGMKVLSKNACMSEISQTLDNEITIDPTFPAFILFCQKHNLEVRVVSCGIDWFIKRILDRCDLGHLPVHSAELHWNDHGPEVHIPHRDAGCAVSKGRFSLCKGRLIRGWQAEGEFVTMIGDGASDFCGAKEADRVFARDALITFCERQIIPFTPVNSFQDVQEKFWASGKELP